MNLLKSVAARAGRRVNALVIVFILFSAVAAHADVITKASIESEIITDWKTVSRITPVIDCPNCAVMRYDTCNQVGTSYLVTYAVIDYKGEKKRFEVERAVIDLPKKERSVACGQDFGILFIR